MYPQFIDGNSMRGVPDPSRGPVRHPFMNYYGSKLPDGVHYGGGIPQMVRPPNPYTGKPDTMYPGHAGWNPMMMHQPYPMSKPPISKPEYHHFPGQEHMYSRMYGTPDPSNPYNQGFPPGVQQFHQPPHYPSPSHHYPGGMPGVDNTGGSYHESFTAPSTPQQNDQWSRQQSQPQQQPSVVINDGGAVSDGGSPAPRSSIGWGPSGELLTPDPNKPTRPPVSPRNSPGLHKEPSVSSLKEALLSGYEGKGNSVPAQTPGPNLGQPLANLGPSPGIRQSPGLGPSPGPAPNYPGNSSPFLGMPEVRERGSPLTPNVGLTSSTTHMASPAGLIGSGDGGGDSPLLPSQQTPPTDTQKNSFDGPNPPVPINRQPSPFEVDKILGFKENDTQNGKKVSPVDKVSQVDSPASSVGSPRSRKVRHSPSVLSPVDRNHSSVVTQYTLSKEPGRKEFLDALLDHLSQEGIALLRVPTLCKAQLDLYKSFTSVQQLGGFRHVVEKSLWKDVLRSINPFTTSPISPPALRLLQEYYVKMLLPYECHISNTSLQDCVTLYEQKGSPTVNNTHEGRDMVNNSTVGDGHAQPLPGNNSSDALLPFAEDSQHSLDGISNQPLPDISVQEAEFVLGIPPSSNQATPSQSFPPNANWPDFLPNQPAIPSDDRGFPSPHNPHVPSPHPGMGGADPSFMYPSFNDQYTDYRNRMQMGHFMNRQPYLPHHAHNIDPGFPPPHYATMATRPSQDASHYNNMEWQWNQQRPRLPPPLPPHLQSMSFQVPPPSSSAHPVPVAQNTSRPSTPQSVPLDRSSPHPPPSAQSNLEPIKIHWQDQQHAGNTGVTPKNTVGGVMTPPPPSHLPIAKDHMTFDKTVKPLPTMTKVPDQTKVSRPSVPAPPPVELTEPVYRKRRRLNSDHCGQVEPWRVMMSLKSGLAPDSTWALDTLSILLHDDRTVGFFYLKHHHSLLNTLVDHFTMCLHDIFGDVFDTLPKYSEQSNDKDLFGNSQPIQSSFYGMTKADVRMGRTDLLSHVHSCFKMSCEDDPELSSELDKDHLKKVTFRSKPVETSSKVCRVDETPLNDLLKRDALGERILFHLKTPRRVMVCSPIQKFFPSTEEILESLVHEENEILKREPTPLVLHSEEHESLIRRCLTLSNIIRSLSFIPGNDVEFSQHTGLLVILGKIILHHHSHPPKPPSSSLLFNMDSESSDSDTNPPKLMTAREEDELYWWWDCLEVLRQNVFIILANVAGQLDLSIYPEAINYPLIDGLLHWLVCPSSTASDPLPDSAVVSSLSPQRLVLEALAKISISEINVDYILATPTLPRLDLVYDTLLNFISQRKHPASKQFALVFLSNLAQGDEGASRMIGQQKMAIPMLLECLESAEHLQQQHQGKGRMMYNQPNPEDLTSLSIAMLRRTAITLHCLARVHLNRVSFLPYCNRLLSLVMSSALDPSLTSILSDVLFELNRIA